MDIPDVDFVRYRFNMTGALFKHEPNIMATPNPLTINLVQHSTLNWNKCSTQKDGDICNIVAATVVVAVAAAPLLFNVAAVEAVVASFGIFPHTHVANDITIGISSKNFILTAYSFEDSQLMMTEQIKVYCSTCSHYNTMIEISECVVNRAERVNVFFMFCGRGCCCTVRPPPSTGSNDKKSN
jgi:hypothetical protein